MMFALLGCIGAWLTLFAASPHGNSASLAFASCGVAVALGCFLIEGRERA